MSECDCDRLLAALWDIRMAAETASVDDNPWVLPNRIIHLALSALGPDKRRAQELAAERRRHDRTQEATG